MSKETLLNRAVPKAALKHPELGADMIGDVAAIRSQSWAAAERDIQKLRQQSMRIPGANRMQVNRQVSAIQRDAQLKAQEIVLNRYGEDGKRAWLALDKEMHRPGIIEGALKPFLNSEAKGFNIGGIRPGGIIGGLLGFMAAMKFGGFSNGFLGVIATFVATFLGASAGNVLMDSAANAISPPSPEPTPGLGLARAPGISRRGPSASVTPLPPSAEPPPPIRATAAHAAARSELGELAAPPKVAAAPLTPENWRGTR